jgi:hypothetical protein
VFSWLRRKPPAPPPAAEPAPVARKGDNPANPGIASKMTWTFANGGRTWQEPMDLVQTLARVLRERGREVTTDEFLVIDAESQLVLRPLLQSMEPGGRGPTKTNTTIEITHPIRILSPVFEYQHSMGKNLEESLVTGFRQWYDLDFVALCDAVREKAEKCQEMLVEPLGDPGRKLRITLGPAICQRERQPAASAAGGDHEFCPCCLFTRSLKAFQPLLASPGFHAIRLFALKNPKGQVAADCRVDGEDHAEGQKALIEYANTWPAAGMEYRKQYVLVQPVNPDLADTPASETI